MVGYVVEKENMFRPTIDLRSYVLDRKNRNVGDCGNENLNIVIRAPLHGNVNAKRFLTKSAYP